jgi:DHA1 family bicyclomycin/chloramphenicol resistance-like MFS transporter
MARPAPDYAPPASPATRKASMTATPIVLLALLFGAVSALPPLSIDSSLPALPAMAAGLGVSAGTIQLNLSAYMIGSAFGQLVIGPLSDRHGRRPLLLAGLGLYIAASAGCAFAGDLGTLIALRFVQGLGTACGRVLPRAMVRDLFEREHAARMLSYMMAVGGASPILAPLIGGFLTGWAGWRAVFLMMTVYAVVLLAVSAMLMRETLPPEARQRPSFGRILVNYWMILRHRTVLAYLACVICANVGLFAFLAASSSVLIGVLGETPARFGVDFAMVMCAFTAANLVGGKLVVRVGIDRLLGVGVAICAVGGALMAGLALAGVLSIWAIVVPMFIYIAGYGLVLPQATAGALSPFPQLAGTASALVGFVQFSGGAASATVVGLLHDGTQMPMTLAIGAAGIGVAVAFRVFVRPLGRP